MWFKGFVFVLLLASANLAPAQTVTRGPYLQQPTDQSIIVRWRTDVATDSVVRYGPDAATLNQSTTVAGGRTEHSVLINGLSAQARYFYSVGDSLGALAGDATYHFFTAPTPGTAVPTRIWVIGDSGTADANAEAVRDAYKAYTGATDPADFFLMLGDNAYNDGTDAEYQDAVFDIYPEILRQIPVWPTLGNHDGHTADSATQSGPYYDIFQLPTSGEAGGLASGTEAYYSFDYGNIHFVVLESYETDRSPGGNMLQWLEADLALNDKPWVIAFWHHPPYTKGSHNSDTEGQLIDMRQNALPILEAWGVDLVMTGHSHSYERSYLLDGHYGSSTTLDPDLMVVDPGDGGDAGDGAYQKPDIIAAEHAGAVYAVAGSSGKVSGGSLNHPAMVVSLNSLGSMVLHVAGNRLDSVFIDEGGSVLDEFTMLKTPDNEPPLIDGASAEDANHVLVDYAERIDPTTAGDSTNYSIVGLTVSAAAVLAGNRTVRLTTSTMTAGNNYVLTVNNVQDEVGNTIAPNTQVPFQFVQYVTRSFQDGLAPDSGYAGTADTYIRQATSSSNYGLATTLQVDGDEPSGSGTDMNILIAWDISTIPANAVVDSATIRLNVLNASSGAYDCFQLLRPWSETGASWSQASGGNAWASPGALGLADSDSAESCTVTAGALGPLAINLNGTGLDMVQAWVDGSAANHGILIHHPSTTDGADFASSDSTTAMNRPRLEITYHVPTTSPEPPAAPGGLSAATWSANRIDLAWNDHSNDEDGFKVERSPDGASAWGVVANLAANTTDWSDTGLSPGTTYFYRVLAFNGGGDSAASNHASDTTFTNPRTIQFAGRSWTVKSSASPVGPGPNLFSATASDVWVDSSGYLHMRISYRDGSWRASEVISDDVLGHGTYTFTLGSRVDLLDRNIVVGLFTWDTSAPQFNYREIDIEFARWGDPLNDNSQYVVQPWDNPGNSDRWETTLSGNDSTHSFAWHPDRVEFSSHQGTPPGQEIRTWTYNGPDVPPEGTDSGNARINFWMQGGNPPFDGQDAELIVKDFTFLPLPAGSSDHTASGETFGSGTVSGGYQATWSDDGVAQSVTERESGGKKSDRYSYLQHTWSFNLPASAMATLHANAWSGGSADGDQFEISWSSNGSSFSPLFTVNSQNTANLQTAVLPGTPSGTVYVRITDTDQTPGNRNLDTVFVDHLFIRTESAGGEPPDAPSGLVAGAAGHDRINLSWSDNSANESGFGIERSTNGVSFSQVDTVAANSTAYSDTGLTGNTTYWYRVSAFNASGASGYSNTSQATTDSPPPPPDIALSLNGYKVRGQHVIDLNWSGAATSSVDIRRNGSLLITTANDGSYTDETGNKGAGSYTYQVCEAASSVCSDLETVSF